jgi:hypothetical protein
MGGTPGPGSAGKLQNVNELLRALRCESLDDLSALVDARSAFAGGVTIEEFDQVIILIDRYGIQCEFPITANEFWDYFDSLEADVHGYIRDRG